MTLCMHRNNIGPVFLVLHMEHIHSFIVKRSTEGTQTPHGDFSHRVGGITSEKLRMLHEGNCERRDEAQEPKKGLSAA